MHYIVRPMQIEDISQVNAVDREAFPTQWPPPPFRRDLNSKLVRYLVALEETDDPCGPAEPTAYQAKGSLQRSISKIRSLFNKGYSSGDGKAAQNKHNVIGYAAMWLMVDEAHLTSIAVKETHRRHGIGELLLVSMIDLAMRLKAQVVTLETRVSNVSAQALYEKYGFSITGMRRGYYSDDGEDAVIMTTESIVSPQYQARFQELRRICLERCAPVKDIQLV